MQSNNLPVSCPSCSSQLEVASLACAACSTQVSGRFALPLLLELSHEEQEFLLLFLKASGSLKAMAKELGFSYPKVRNMLDELISKINQLENEKERE